MAYDHVLKKAEVKQAVFRNSCIALVLGADGELMKVKKRWPHCQLHLPRRPSIGSAAADTRQFGNKTGCVSGKHDDRLHLSHSPFRDDRQYLQCPPCLPESKTFADAMPTHYESDENRAYPTYDTFVSGGRASGTHIDRQKVNTAMALSYDSLHQQRSNTGAKNEHWCFLQPRERQRRDCILFYRDEPTIPFINFKMPHWLQETVLRISRPLIPILMQGCLAMKPEQQECDRHWDTSQIGRGSDVPLLRRLAATKWQDHLAKTEPSRLER